MAENPVLPTRKELWALPRWGRVAYAVRCAQRVQGLAHPVARRAVDGAIQTIMEAAITPSSDAAKWRLAARSAAVASGSRISTREYSAAMTASLAAESASEDTVASVEAASQAAMFAQEAIVRYLNDLHYDSPASTVERAFADAIAKFRIACEHDVAKLLLSSAAQLSERTDEASVDPSTLGPLWPNGEPADWPKSQNASVSSDAEQAMATQGTEPRLLLRVATLPLSDTPENREDLKAHLRKLIKAANLVNREHGGPGLEIAGARLVSPAGVGVGVSDE